MKPLTILFSILVLFSASSFAYDINDLIRDGRAYHERFQSDVGDMKMELEASFTAAAAGNASMNSIHYSKGVKWRMEADMNMGESMGGAIHTVMLFDGENYWTLAMGMKTKLTKEQMQQQDQKTSYWNEPPEDSKIIGEESVSGRDCWIVEYPSTPVMKSAPKYWIDKQRFVFVQTQTELSGEKIRAEYSDFRKVKDDYEIPHHIEMFSGDKQSMIADIKKIEIGAGLSDELFDPEKLGGAEMDIKNIDLEQLMKQAEEMKKKYGGGE
jgi:outer membrane lipoprotein-sorting protein